MATLNIELIQELMKTRNRLSELECSIFGATNVRNSFELPVQVAIIDRVADSTHLLEFYQFLAEQKFPNIEADYDQSCEHWSSCNINWVSGAITGRRLFDILINDPRNQDETWRDLITAHFTKYLGHGIRIRFVAQDE